MGAGRRPEPIHHLPEDYREVYYLELTTGRNFVLLNLLALLPTALASVMTTGWILLIWQFRGVPISNSASILQPTPLWGLVAVVMVILLHEALHGLAIYWTGHKPRFGVKPNKLVVYTTADKALFRRGEFMVIVLAPLIGISLGGLVLLMLVVDVTGAFFLALAVIINAGSSIGDLWMWLVVRRYSGDALIRDEADCLRVYVRDSSSA